MDQTSTPSGGAANEDQPSEQELRAAYETELNRISSSEMILQTTVSLINIGGRRLGLSAPGAPAPTEAERDLEQVRDAIDGARALMPILERRMPRELGPMRDAVAQLQMAYAREAQSAPGPAPAAAQASPPAPDPRPESAHEDAPAAPSAGAEEEQNGGPGPAQASGRLWVPGHH
jgi:hypothetical protein